MRLMPTVFALVASCGYTFVAKAECDISQFKDYMSYKQDIMTNLAYINRVASREDRSKQDKADLDILDYGTFNYAQASRFTSSLETLLDIKWSQHDQEWVLTSNLSQDGVTAYIKCVENENANLIVNLSNAASDTDEFIVDYKWRPNYNAPNPATLHTVLTNATSKDIPKKVKTPSADAFSVKRISMYKPLELNIHVDGQPYPSITLPAFPAKKLQKELRTSSEYKKIEGGNSSETKEVCVTLDNAKDQDALIVPNSLQVTINQDTGIRAHMQELSRRYNDRQACANIGWLLEAGDGTVAGTAMVTANILKSVPVQDPLGVTKVIGETPMFKGQQ